MKYKTQDKMDARIERIVKAKTKHFYTDWKNYDRVAYMKYKGSSNRKDKRMILIARECGTYLYTMDELENYSFAKTVYEYYMDQNCDYYEINLITREVKKHTPNLKWLKEVAA